MVKLKGELLWVQQMVTTWEDPVISVSRIVGHLSYLILVDFDGMHMIDIILFRSYPSEVFKMGLLVLTLVCPKP